MYARSTLSTPKIFVHAKWYLNYLIFTKEYYTSIIKVKKCYIHDTNNTLFYQILLNIFLYLTVVTGVIALE